MVSSRPKVDLAKRPFLGSHRQGVLRSHRLLLTPSPSSPEHQVSGDEEWENRQKQASKTWVRPSSHGSVRPVQNHPSLQTI